MRIAMSIAVVGLLACPLSQGRAASPRRARVSPSRMKEPPVRKVQGFTPGRIHLLRSQLLGRKASSRQMGRLRSLMSMKTLDRRRLAAALKPLVQGQPPARTREILLAVAVDLRGTLARKAKAPALSPLAKKVHGTKARTWPKLIVGNAGAAGGRQEASTSFENFDEKTNQLFNMLSTLMKQQKETSGAVSRNML